MAAGQQPHRDGAQPAAEREQRSANRWQRALYLPLTILAWLAVVLILGWLLGHVLHTLVIIVLAALLAFALSPLVGILRRRLSRPLAIGVAYLIGLAIIIGLITLLVMTAAGQVVNLVQNLPSYAQRVQDLEPRVVGLLAPFGVTAARLSSLNQQALAELQRVGGVLAAGSLGILSGLAGDLVDAVLVLILSVYFTTEGPKVGRFLREGVPDRWKAPGGFLARTISQVVGGYIRGTLTMAVLIGALVGVGLAIIGVPYAVLLGVLAFFMEFIPIVGVLVSGVVSLVVALPRGSVTVVVVLAYFVIVHVIEGDVVGPRIMGEAVGIHPATGIIALVAGTELFGIWGALFASPVAGLLQALVTAVWRGITAGNDSSFLAAAVAIPEEEEAAGEETDAA